MKVFYLHIYFSLNLWGPNPVQTRHWPCDIWTEPTVPSIFQLSVFFSPRSFPELTNPFIATYILNLPKSNLQMTKRSSNKFCFQTKLETFIIEYLLQCRAFLPSTIKDWKRLKRTEVTTEDWRTEKDRTEVWVILFQELKAQSLKYQGTVTTLVTTRWWGKIST